VADGDLFGFNKRGNLILNLLGVGDTTGVRVGLAGALVIVFLRISLGVGEAAGDSAAEGEVALSAGEVAPVFFACGFLVVKGIRWGSQSVTAIELAQPKWLGRSQTLVEKFCWL
jgi:hypothetical protein